MKSEKALIVVGFILISIIWGSTWLAIKVGLDSVPPLYGIALRFSIAAIILYSIIKVRKEPIPFDKTSVYLYFNLGVLSFSLPFALVYWGEQYIASGLASILFAAYPFVVAICSHLFLPNERLSFFKSTGIALGFIGVLIIFWSDLHLGETSTLGMAAILCSTVMQGTSLVIVKRTNHHISPTVLSLGGMVVGLIIMYPMAFILENFSNIHFDEKGIGSILYLGTFGTVVTFVVYYWLLKRVEVVYLSLVSFVTPILAVILGNLLLHEILSPRVFYGTSLVLTGILIANGKDLIALLKTKSINFFNNNSNKLK